MPRCSLPQCRPSRQSLKTPKGAGEKRRDLCFLYIFHVSSHHFDGRIAAYYTLSKTTKTQDTSACCSRGV